VSGPTEADRERATSVLADAAFYARNTAEEPTERADRVASALAAERARARAEAFEEAAKFMNSRADAVRAESPNMNLLAKQFDAWADEIRALVSR